MHLDAFVDLAGTGATWVLYLLLGLSTLQLAVMIERGWVFFRARASRARLDRILAEAIAKNAVAEVAIVLAGEKSVEGRVLAAGAAQAQHGAEAADEVIGSTLISEKLRLEKRLSFLGTLGNNAPFIGLFGTVLGIIHAFADLASQGAGQASRTVMSGISEALISTAVGLIVAIPAVVAFNYFQRVIKTRLGEADSLGGMLLAYLKRQPAKGAESSQSFRKAA